MALWEFSRNREVAGRALVISAGLMQGPRGADFNRYGPFGAQFGICGVGVVYLEEYSNLIPAVFYLGEPSPRLFRWNDNSSVVEALRAAFGNDLDWVRDTAAIPVLPTELLARPGEDIDGPFLSGLFGAPVTWAGKQGFLTAGHVADATGSNIADKAGNSIGQAVFVRKGQAIQPQGCNSSSVDVGVIELNTGVAQSNNLGIRTSAIPKPNSAVDVHTSNGVKPAKINGAASWWWVSAQQVVLTELYLSGAVTVSGDSGGPVLLQGGNGEIIGHVVAGGTVSCYQDIDHQLAEIRKDPAFQNISI